VADTSELDIEQGINDLVFRYVVSAQASVRGLRHAHQFALQGVIVRAPAGGVLADLTLQDPLGVDEIGKDGPGGARFPLRPGQWLADYPKRIELDMQGLWHQNSSELSVYLSHRGRLTRLTSALSSAGIQSPSYGVTESAIWATVPQRGRGYSYAFSDIVGPNLALRGLAVQSSTLQGRHAYLAIDGNIDGRLSGGSVIHTGLDQGAELEPYWQLSLPMAGEQVGTIRLWNRVKDTFTGPSDLKLKGQNASRLFPCWVMSLNASTDIMALRGLDEALRSATWKIKLTKEQDVTSLVVPPATQVMHLRVQLDSWGYLSFAEFEVSLHF
jgi:hypothetical protein